MPVVLFNGQVSKSIQQDSVEKHWKDAIGCFIEKPLQTISASDLKTWFEPGVFACQCPE